MKIIKRTLNDKYFTNRETIPPPAYKIEAILTQTSGETEIYYNYDN